MVECPKPESDRRGQTIEADAWVLELVSYPDDTRPIGRRVAMLLKFAGRALGLKCVLVRNPTPEETKR